MLSVGRDDVGVIDVRGLSYEVFCIVEDSKHDYTENHLKNRVDKILSELSCQGEVLANLKKN